jgi:hypothetical protein
MDSLSKVHCRLSLTPILQDDSAFRPPKLELQFSGRVTYNGHGMEEFVPQRTSAYISQHDLHIGEMTVRETLAFRRDVKGLDHVMVS